MFIFLLRRKGLYIKLFKNIAVSTFLKGKSFSIMSLESPNDVPSLLIVVNDGLIPIRGCIYSCIWWNRVGELQSDPIHCQILSRKETLWVHINIIACEGVFVTAWL